MDGWSAEARSCRAKRLRRKHHSAVLNMRSRVATDTARRAACKTEVAPHTKTEGAQPFKLEVRQATQEAADARGVKGERDED